MTLVTSIIILIPDTLALKSSIKFNSSKKEILLFLRTDHRKILLQEVMVLDNL